MRSKRRMRGYIIIIFIHKVCLTSSASLHSAPSPSRGRLFDQDGCFLKFTSPHLPQAVPLFLAGDGTLLSFGHFPRQGNLHPEEGCLMRMNFQNKEKADVLLTDELPNCNLYTKTAEAGNLLLPFKFFKLFFVCCFTASELFLFKCRAYKLCDFHNNYRYKDKT